MPRDFLIEYQIATVNVEKHDGKLEILHLLMFFVTSHHGAEVTRHVLHTHAYTVSKICNGQ